MIASSKCDFSLVEQQMVRPIKPVMVSSSKCDFSMMMDGLSVYRDGLGRGARLDFADRLGSVRASSSKCDWSIRADDVTNRFSLSASISASSKCDFSVVVDFGIRGGERFRAVAGGSSKCDFTISTTERINPPYKNS